VSSGQINLIWNEALSGGATRISIERSTNSGSQFVEIARTANTLSYLDTNLAANTTYYYRARALNINTWSSYSDETGATTCAARSDIPLTALRLWLKADSGLAQVDTDTGISLWPDQSGNGNHVSQIRPAQEPSWVSGSVDGSLPAVHFDSTGGQWMNERNFITDATGVEAFVVLKAATAHPSSPRGVWYYSPMGNGPNESYPYFNGSIWDDFGSGAIHGVGIPRQPLDQYHVYEVASSSDDWSA